MTAVEAMLAGRALTPAMAGEIERAVARDVEYLADGRCGAPYKRQVVGVLVRRALAQALACAGVRAV
jgi:CO/xanthine dehydrogenase FAD-binding subunit